MGAIQDIFEQFNSEVIADIRANMSNAGQIATGKTAGSLQGTATDSRTTITGARHIMVTETGRRPWQGGPESGLKSKLMEWIQAKNIPIRRTLEKDAAFLAYWINKNGTKLFREGGRKDIITPVIDNKIPELLRTLRNVQIKEIRTIINDTITTT